MSLVRSILEAGTSGEGSRRARQIRITNLWGVVLAALLVLYVPIFVAIGATGLGIACAPLAALYATFPWLNARGAFRAVRVFLMGLGTSVVFVYSALLGEHTNIHHVMYVIALVPLLLTSGEERATRAALVALPVTVGVALQAVGWSYFPASPLSEGVQAIVATLLVPTVFFLLLVAVLYFAVSNERAEASLADVNEAMRRVLDNVEEGLVVIDLDGRPVGARSAALARLLPELGPDATLVAAIEAADPPMAPWLAMGLEAIREDFLPLSLTLTQLPERLTVHRDGQPRVLRLRWLPLQEPCHQLLVMVADISPEIARERAEAAHRELAAAAEKASKDRRGFAEFVAETDALVARFSPTLPRDDAWRLLHTLKGNAGLFGLPTLVELAHRLEGELDDARPVPQAALAEGWAAVRSRIAALIGDVGRDEAIVPWSELDALGAAIVGGAARPELAARVHGLRWEPIRPRLETCADHAVGLARRLGKGEIVVHVDADGLRADPLRWAPVWSVWVHAVRNAVDHGLEADRSDKGPGRLWLSARYDGDVFTVAIEDDGRGVDWATLEARAHARGAVVKCREDLFASGVSTRDDVTDVSGRGVGMSAVRRVCEGHGGQFSVTDRPGGGTRVAMRFPGAVGVLAAPATRAA